MEEAKPRATKGRPLGVTHQDNDYKVDVFYGGEAPIVVDTEEMAKHHEEEVGHRIGAPGVERAGRCSKSEVKALLAESGPRGAAAERPESFELEMHEDKPPRYKEESVGKGGVGDKGGAGGKGAAADVHGVGGGRAACSQPAARIQFGCTGAP